MKFMRTFSALILAAFALSAPAFAQNTTSIIASNGIQAGSTPLASGKLCFVAVNDKNKPISFTGPGVGLNLAGHSFCQVVTAGAIVGSLPVPNGAVTLPHVCYNGTVHDNATSSDTPINDVPLCNVTDATFDLGTANLGATSSVPVAGFSAGNGAPSSACVAPSSYVQLDAMAGSNIWDCQSGIMVRKRTVTHGSVLVQFGDSITYGLYLDYPTAQRFGAVMSQDLGIPVTDRAISGDMACDIWPRQLLPNLPTDNPTSSTAKLYTVMIGTNDVNTKGVGAYEAIFKTCQQAVLSWLAVPDVNKVLPGSAAFTVLSGGNSAGPDDADDGPGHMGAAGMTVAGTLRSTITTYGKPIYVWQYISAGIDEGSFYISIDSGPQLGPFITSPGTGSGLHTQNGTDETIGFTGRFPVAAGSHTVDFIWHDGVVGITGVGTLPALPYYESSTIAVGQIPNQITTGGVASPASIAQYNADVAASVALFAQDGADIRLVRDQDYMLGVPAEMHDQLHPGPPGHIHLAQAFEDALQAVPHILPAGYVSVLNTSASGEHLPDGKSMIFATAGPEALVLPVAAMSGDPTLNSVQAQVTIYAFSGDVTVTAPAGWTLIPSSPITIPNGHSATFTTYAHNGTQNWIKTGNN
jgi:lysophospholipase L1-like esterase